MENQIGKNEFQDELNEYINYLNNAWKKNSISFMKWFLSIPSSAQISLLRQASPDIPTTSNTSTPSSLLVPELTIEYLLEENGKNLVRFMNKWAKSEFHHTLCIQDLEYLKGLHSSNKMPIFTETKNKEKESILYIIKDDKTKNIHKVSKTLAFSSPELWNEILKKIQENIYIELDVWITLQIRQKTIFSFLTFIIDTFDTYFRTEQIAYINKIGCRTCGTSCKNPTNNTNNNNNNNALMKCSCFAAYYCSIEHQKIDWPYHKVSCKKIRNEMNKSI